MPSNILFQFSTICKRGPFPPGLSTVTVYIRSSTACVMAKTFFQCFIDNFFSCCPFSWIFSSSNGELQATSKDVQEKCSAQVFVEIEIYS